MPHNRYYNLLVFALTSACSRDGDVGESSGGTGVSTLDSGTSTPTENDGSSTESADSASSSSGTDWPECLDASGPDITVGILLDPVPPDQMWHRYSGPCTVSSATAGAGTTSIDLVCSGADGPAADWTAGLTLEGFDSGFPVEVAAGANVELIVVLQQSNLRFTAFSLSAAGELVLAGLSGNNPNVEDGMGGDPQALWAPLVVSPEAIQVCEGQPGVECPLSVARNSVVFTGLDVPAVEVFDHGEFATESFEYRLGRALAFVDDGSGVVCEGSDPTWYDFIVARLP